MNTTILDGRTLSKQILVGLIEIIRANKLDPKLLIIQVGDNAASEQYIALKKKRGSEIGVEVLIERAESSQDICKLVERYANSVHGIMIQLPLPTNINTQETLGLIPQDKDVDGLLLEKSNYNTAVADAVIELLLGYKIDIENKRILVIGDTPYVGNSIKTALLKTGHKNIGTVNEFTQNNDNKISNADIVISCVGRPHIFSTTQLKNGAVLIDVGTSSNNEGKIVGDFEVSDSSTLSAYTPVPGGVGPMTVAMLLKNVVTAALNTNLVE